MGGISISKRAGGGSRFAPSHWPHAARSSRTNRANANAWWGRGRGRAREALTERCLLAWCWRAGATGAARFAHFQLAPSTRLSRSVSLSLALALALSRFSRFSLARPVRRRQYGDRLHHHRPCPWAGRQTPGPALGELMVCNRSINQSRGGRGQRCSLVPRPQLKGVGCSSVAVSPCSSGDRNANSREKAPAPRSRASC